MSYFVQYKKLTLLKPKANPYPSRFYKWQHSLGFTCIILLLMGGILRFYKPLYSKVEQGLFEGTAWIQKAFTSPFQKTESLLEDTHVLMHLKEEYVRVSQENEKLKW